MEESDHPGEDHNTDGRRELIPTYRVDNQEITMVKVFCTCGEYMHNEPLEMRKTDGED